MWAGRAEKYLDFWTDESMLHNYGSEFLQKNTEKEITNLLYEYCTNRVCQKYNMRIATGAAWNMVISCL